MKNEVNMLEHALGYIALYWSIIPVDSKTKKPLVKSWKEYQLRLPTEDEIKSWYTQFPDAGVAIVTGKKSNLVVFDIDPRHGGTDELFKQYNTVSVKTGGGGKHFYFKYKEGINNKANLLPGIDVRGEGGYVIAPPSMHSSGLRYEWLHKPRTTSEIQSLPDELLSLFNKKTESQLTLSGELGGGVIEGTRNTSAASIAGKLLKYFPKHEEEEVWLLLKSWNQQNKPPLDEKELRTVFESIKKRELSNRQEEHYEEVNIPNAMEFMKQDFGETDWLIDNLIPSGGSAILVAKRESYKTWLALYISECVTHGSALWGKFITNKTNVLYISNDDPAGSFKNRLEHFDFNESLFIYHQALPIFMLEGNNGSFESVHKLVIEKRIGMVIVDILRNTHNRDSNTDKDSMSIMNKFKELRSENVDLVFLFISHPSKENSFEKRFGGRKSEEAVGSYYWEAAVDTVLSLSKDTDSEQTDSVVITVTKNKQSEEKHKPFVGIQKAHNGSIKFVYEEKLPEKFQPKTEIAEEAIIDLVKNTPNILRCDLIDELVSEGICSARTVETILPQMVKDKKLILISKNPHKYGTPQNAGTYIGGDLAESEKTSLFEEVS